jgi:hypothetical protein
MIREYINPTTIMAIIVKVACEKGDRKVEAFSNSPLINSSFVSPSTFIGFSESGMES